MATGIGLQYAECIHFHVQEIAGNYSGAFFGLGRTVNSSVLRIPEKAAASGRRCHSQVASKTTRLDI